MPIAHGIFDMLDIYQKQSEIISVVLTQKIALACPE